MTAREILATKIRLMDDEIKFLEFAWAGLSQFERDKIINEYVGTIPRKYKR
jgi:hypothetical protein